jgi:hypothetical protein
MLSVSHHRAVFFLSCLGIALVAGCSGRIDSSLNEPGNSSGSSGGTSGNSSGGTSGSSSGGQCEALPTCSAGYEQVTSSADCPAGTTCTAVELCGSRILCRQIACSAVAACDAGDKELGRFSDCNNTPGCSQPGVGCPNGQTCYTRKACGQLVVCGKTLSCREQPMCDSGDKEIWSAPICKQGPCPPVAPKPRCADGAKCYERQRCDTQIMCQTSEPNCDAVPSCKMGDREIPSSICKNPPPDVKTYEETVCGQTICCLRAR